MAKANVSRRDFIKKSALVGAAVGLAGPFSLTRAAGSPNDQVTVAIMAGRVNPGLFVPHCCLSRWHI
ncbi:MAG: twin-arginine translocation signal domain-containing protein [Balneolaceae bacterium]|nr:MAG: twin-arginine translocation signal domain-containing protein [Balneolaceae bacterium]